MYNLDVCAIMSVFMKLDLYRSTLRFMALGRILRGRFWMTAYAITTQLKVGYYMLQSSWKIDERKTSKLYITDTHFIFRGVYDIKLNWFLKS